MAALGETARGILLEIQAAGMDPEARCDLAAAIVASVLAELEDDIGAIACVAQGKLEVARDAVSAAGNLLS